MKQIARNLVAAATVFVFLFGLVLSCVGPDKEKSAEKLTPKEKKLADEMRAEIELGRNMAGRLLKYYGTLGDESLIGYVNQVGNYVASYGDYPERRYMFAILDTELRNAFACPGGYILVTKGAMRAAKDEAEIAAILAHETVHVGAQHMWRTLRKMKEKEMDRQAAALDKNKNIPAAVKMRQRPTSEESETSKLLTRYLSGGAAGIGFTLMKAAKAGMNLILEKGIDKKLEFEADREGVKYAIRAGYEPKALYNYLDRLQKAKDKNYAKSRGKTHPSLKKRKAQILRTLKALKADQIVGASGTKRYKKMLAKLPPLEKG